VSLNEPLGCSDDWAFLTRFQEQVEILGGGIPPISRFVRIAAHCFNGRYGLFYRETPTKNQPGSEHVSGAPPATLAVHNY